MISVFKHSQYVMNIKLLLQHNISYDSIIGNGRFWVFNPGGEFRRLNYWRYVSDSYRMQL